LAQVRRELQTTREQRGFTAMLLRALGDPGDRLPNALEDNVDRDLNRLDEALASGAPADTRQAQERITTDLFMTVEAYGRLAAVRAKDNDPNALRKPTAAEWSAVYKILTTAQKEKRLYTDWLEQEQAPLTGVPNYWTARKATLPLWRAGSERRGAWRQALELRSQAPLIDPDLVGPGDFRDPTSGPVFQLWLERRNAINGWLAEFSNNLPDETDLTRFDRILAQDLFDDAARAITRSHLQALREANGLDELLRELFGDPLPDLAAIAAGVGGNDVTARVTVAETLFLTIEGFEELVQVHDLEAAHAAVTDEQWRHVYGTLTRGALVRAVMSAEEARRNGNDITARLDQLSLTMAGFNYFVRIRDAAARQAPVLSSEWDDVYAILVQVRKRSAFAQWRRDEAGVVVHGPDQFMIPAPPPPRIPPLPPPTLPAWRATTSDRQDWLDSLQARIDQETAVIAAYRDTLSATEAQVLPGLRDALILAIRTDPPLPDLHSKARWVTNNLLIDAEADGCQETTRISQAIETIQGLLWSVRSGLLQQVYPGLALDADQFDAEWNWIGSYATWRSAMFVFLYPENLLVPSLRRSQTPAFKRLVNDLRANRALAPEQACQLARTYSDYFHDVATLTLVAACQGTTRLHTGDCRSRTEQSERSLLYLFARGAVTEAIYWSTYDAVAGESNPDYAQTFWDVVPGVDDPGLLMLGAVPYTLPSGARYIYLFAHDRSQQKLLYCKYSLDDQEWLGTLSTLDPPKQAAEDLTFVVAQRSEESDPPRIAAQSNGRIQVNQMNRAGDGWANNDWTLLAIPAQRIGPLVGIVRVADDRFFLFANTGGQLSYRCFGVPADPFWHPLGQGTWVGAFAWPQSESVYAFWNSNDDALTQYRHLQTYDVPPAPVISPGHTSEPLRWSIDWLDRWLSAASGLSLRQLSIDDVATFSVTSSSPGVVIAVPATTVDQLLSALPPVNSSPDDWESAIASWLDQFDKFIKNSEDWTFVDRVIVSASGFDLRQIIQKLRAQDPVDPLSLPDYGYAPPIRGEIIVNRITVTFADSPDPRTPAPIGSIPQDSTILVAYQKGPPIGVGIFWSAWTRYDWFLMPASETRAAPFVAGPFDIVENLSTAALQLRRQDIKNAFLQNTPGPRSDPSYSYLWPRSNQSYLEEAYYFVPVQIALQLQQRGHYIAALDYFRTVYDYGAPLDRRKIYYGLTLEERLQDVLVTAPAWLLDPLNPHAIAETRANCYTRFTLLSLIRCLIDYADAEFTNDTTESVWHAEELYLAALDLLNTAELQQQLNGCDQLIGGLEIDIGGREWIPVINRIEGIIGNIGDRTRLQNTVEAIRSALRRDGTPQARLDEIFSLARAEVATLPAPPTYAAAVLAMPVNIARCSRALLADTAVADAAAAAGASASSDFLHAVAFITALTPNALAAGNQELPWLRNSIVTRRDDVSLATRPGDDLLAARDPLDALASLKAGGGGGHVPALSFDFCIPPNPVIQAFRLHAELDLYNLRTCRNIAGVKRELDPYAAPTDTTTGLPQIGVGGPLQLPGALTVRPTPYRYSTLIERAKQLIQLAAQIEVAMLGALEKRDVEFYSQLKARQDIRLTQAGVRLQDLRVQQARDGVTLAKLQQQRAQIQADHYAELIQAGYLEDESDALQWMADAAGLQLGAMGMNAAAAALYASAAITSSIGGPADEFNALAAASAQLAGGLGALAGAFSTRASRASLEASYERRNQEWEFQRTLAQQDVQIGEQQVTIAEDNVRVAGQEHVIAQIQSDNAKETLDFLTNKFTNADLYDWMSNVLGGVYSYFLRQATATARQAENQLAFERQTTPPAFIQADYWDAPGDYAGVSSESAQPPDRRGLTGSARLLEDIQQLDQYAFDTDRRKRQLTKAFPLARLLPSEFQRFRETGTLTFVTPMESFDQDFPGHYLRLIKRVRVSVIALIPPTQGIRASLSSTGISRVTVGGDIFQTVVIRRDPETVALSSPQNATGLFDLEPQSGMLLPFEGSGVDARWELSMPKAANQFDYTTIADVIVTLDYTALDSIDYRQQVIQRFQTLERPLSADLPFSFRNQLQDAWYDLHNPDQSATPMVVRFSTMREDFPPNLENLRIQQLVLYFARKPGSTFEVDVSYLRFTEARTAGAVGGEASTLDGVISTRRGNAGSWTPILGKSPFGGFELALPNTPETRRLFSEEQIEDMLFVITYTGRSPAWPT
jgi:hypothetical protein